MKQKIIVYLTLFLVCSSIIADIGNIVSAQEDTEEEWDYTGVIRVDSELRRVPIYQPEEMD
ncbi:MAG: hypothetical protein ACTSQE_07535, partial [Candidatus Heimdallarchaeaceae archaeon]